MSTPLTINGQTFNYPDAGENPGWGEDASGWAKATNAAVNSIFGPNDIPLTTSIIADNQSSFVNLIGAAFLTPGTKSFNLQYVVNRTNGTTASNEAGTISGVYSGTDWLISRDYIGEAGMTFNMTAGGQITYKSSSIGGVYVGTMKFKTASGAL